MIPQKVSSVGLTLAFIVIMMPMVSVSVDAHHGLADPPRIQVGSGNFHAMRSHEFAFGGQDIVGVSGSTVRYISHGTTGTGTGSATGMSCDASSSTVAFYFDVAAGAAYCPNWSNLGSLTGTVGFDDGNTGTLLNIPCSGGTLNKGIMCMDLDSSFNSQGVHFFQYNVGLNTAGCWSVWRPDSDTSVATTSSTTGSSNADCGIIGITNNHDITLAGQTYKHGAYLWLKSGMAVNLAHGTTVGTGTPQNNHNTGTPSIVPIPDIKGVIENVDFTDGVGAQFIGLNTAKNQVIFATRSFSTGASTWTPAITINPGVTTQIQTVGSGNIDSDPCMETFVGYGTSRTMRLLDLSGGSCTTLTVTSFISYEASSIIVDDWNDDGKDDVIFTDANDGNLYYLPRSYPSTVSDIGPVWNNPSNNAAYNPGTSTYVSNGPSSLNIAWTESAAWDTGLATIQYATGTSSQSTNLCGWSTVATYPVSPPKTSHSAAAGISSGCYNDDGRTYVHSRAYDHSGHLTYKYGFAEVVIDTTNPTATLVRDTSVSTVNGWTDTASQTYHVDSADVGSGIAEECIWNIATESSSSFCGTSSYTRSVTMPQGTVQIRGSAENGAGLVTTSNTITSYVDSVSPSSVAISMSGADGGNSFSSWHSSRAGTMTVTAEDSTSGIWKLWLDRRSSTSGLTGTTPEKTISLSGSPSTGASSTSTSLSISSYVPNISGAYDWNAIAQDAAGNERSAPEPTFLLDVTDPTLSNPSPTSGQQGSNPLLTITSSDAHSGISSASDSFRYGHDAAPTVTLTASGTGNNAKTATVPTSYDDDWVFWDYTAFDNAVGTPNSATSPVYGFELSTHAATTTYAPSFSYANRAGTATWNIGSNSASCSSAASLDTTSFTCVSDADIASREQLSFTLTSGTGTDATPYAAGSTLQNTFSVALATGCAVSCSRTVTVQLECTTDVGLPFYWHDCSTGLSGVSDTNGGIPGIQYTESGTNTQTQSGFIARFPEKTGGLYNTYWRVVASAPKTQGTDASGDMLVAHTWRAIPYVTDIEHVNIYPGESGIIDVYLNRPWSITGSGMSLQVRCQTTANAYFNTFNGVFDSVDQSLQRVRFTTNTPSWVETGKECYIGFHGSDTYSSYTARTGDTYQPVRKTIMPALDAILSAVFTTVNSADSTSGVTQGKLVWASHADTDATVDTADYLRVDITGDAGSLVVSAPDYLYLNGATTSDNTERIYLPGNSRIYLKQGASPASSTTFCSGLTDSGGEKTCTGPYTGKYWLRFRLESFNSNTNDILKDGTYRNHPSQKWQIGIYA